MGAEVAEGEKGEILSPANVAPPGVWLWSHSRAGRRFRLPGYLS